MLANLLLASALTIYPVDGSIRIDGVLDDAAWAKASTYTQFVEVDPGYNVKPPVKTQVWFTYDKSYLYVAFSCQDPKPEKIRAHLGDRDTAFSDDMVGMMVDTFNDQRRGYEFFVNPLGVQMDLLRSEEEGEDVTWDTIWNSAGRITPTGYAVEMAIPFKSLRFPSKEEQTWRIFFFRIYPREFRYQIGSHPIDRNRNCFFCQIPLLIGLKGIHAGKHWEWIPAVTAHREDQRETLVSPMKTGKLKPDLSLDATWGITPNITLQGTLNPDFSQVEADVLQLEVNTRFALFYPEKRPFFMEGSDYFSTPLQGVYTRSIADPSWGLKGVGKEGKNLLGFIVAEDKIANFLLPGPESSSLSFWDHALFASILRYRRDVGTDSTVGFLATHREGGNYFNTLFGLDGHIRLSKNDFFTAQWLWSQTQDPTVPDTPLAGKASKGYAYEAEYEHDAEFWQWSFKAQELQEGFRADLGFMNRVGVRTLRSRISRTWYGDSQAFFARISPSFYSRWIWNEGSTLLERETGFKVYFQMPLQTNMNIGIERNYEYYQEKAYNRKVLWWWMESQLSRTFSFSFEGILGNKLDYVNNRLGDRKDFTLSGNFKPGRHWQFELRATQEDLTVPEGHLFTARAYTGRLLYHWTTRAFFRILLQFQDITRDAPLYIEEVLPEEKFWASQVLFTYKINPFTLFYLGYSDGIYEDIYTPKTTTNRIFFLKLSYAWRP